MSIRATILAHALAAGGLLLAVGCGSADGVDIGDLCREDKVVTAFTEMEAREDAGAPVPAADLAACLEAATDLAIQEASWSTLATRLALVQRLAGDDQHKALRLAMVRAAAVGAHARLIGEAGEMEQGIEEFDRLRADTEGDPEARTIVDQWFDRGRDEVLQSGELMVEIDGEMVFASSVYAVVPSQQPEVWRPRVGKPVILHNVLLRPECPDEGLSSGGEFDDLTSDSVSADTHRMLLIRRPGTAECVPTAVAWSDAWESQIAAIDPAMLHTCVGTIVAAGIGAAEGATVLVESCRAESERTRRLLRRRKCRVCTIVDDEEICAPGWGRSDQQAGAQATRALCEQLLGPGADVNQCRRDHRTTRRCINTTERELQSDEGTAASNTDDAPPPEDNP